MHILKNENADMFYDGSDVEEQALISAGGMTNSTSFFKVNTVIVIKI